MTSSLEDVGGVEAIHADENIWLIQEMMGVI